MSYRECHIRLHTPVSFGIYDIALFGRADSAEGAAEQNSPVSDIGFLREYFNENFCFLEQVHGDHMLVNPPLEDGPFYPEPADAIIIEDMSRPAVIRTADCIPVLFYSIEEPVYGAVHAGWRGLDSKIVPEVISYLTRSHHIASFRWLVGPHIGLTSYETGPGVYSRFHQMFSAPGKGDRRYLDLNSILYRQLRNAGVSRSHIIWYDDDTLRENKWYSHRRGDTERNFSVIRLSR